MAPAAGEDEFAVWRPQDSALRVEYSRDALEVVRAAVTEGLYKLVRAGLEVGGVLLGESAGDLVRILEVRPIACEYAFGPFFRLSAKEKAELARQLESHARATGLAVVGWYHSQVGGPLRLSEADQALYERHFPGARQVALVLRAERLKPVRAGFFFRDERGVVQTEPAAPEFELAPHARAPRQPVQRTVAAAPEPFTPAPAEPSRPEAALSPVEADEVLVIQRRPRPVFWLMFALAWCLAAASLAYSFRGYLFPPPPEPVAMRLQDSAGQLAILWNVASPAVRQAQGGVLVVVDGGRRRDFSLSQAEASGGSFTYERTSGEIQVILRLSLPQGRSVVGSGRFAGSSAGVVEGLRRERDTLAKELEDLRAAQDANNTTKRAAKARQKAPVTGKDAGRGRP